MNPEEIHVEELQNKLEAANKRIQELEAENGKQRNFFEEIKLFAIGHADKVICLFSLQEINKIAKQALKQEETE